MTEQENWAPVVGHEGHYEVSDLGRVRSLTRTITCKNGAVKTWHGTVMAQALHYKSGRPETRLWSGNKKIIRSTHQLVLEAFVGPRPDGYQGCHNNGICTDNRLSNLRWDTPSANIRDSVLHGTHSSTAKTHCKQGHPFTPENTVVDKSGMRTCRTCRTRRSREATAKTVRQTAERRWAERQVNPERTVFAILADGSHVARYWPGKPMYFREWPPETLRVRERLTAAEFSSLVRHPAAARKLYEETRQQQTGARA